MRDELTPPPPEGEGIENAEGRRVSEGVAGTRKLPWSKPTIWAGRNLRATGSGPNGDTQFENSAYYLIVTS